MGAGSRRKLPSFKFPADELFLPMMRIEKRRSGEKAFRNKARVVFGQNQRERLTARGREHKGRTRRKGGAL